MFCAFPATQVIGGLPVWDHHVFLRFEVQTELSPQSYALFVHNFPQSRPVTAETNTLLRRPESVFTREFTRFRTLTFPA
jgi:hypothetical protein